ncbi:MAG: aspartate--tRNA ligase [Candidatus Woesearchaeota archaeon]
MYRTHKCGELRKEHKDKDVTLSGWVVNPKNHGGIIFTYLRDRYGKTQLVVSSEDAELFKTASALRREDVIRVEGTVKERPDEMKNKDFPTGEIEIHVNRLDIINKAAELPIEIDEGINTSEEMRLKYRYLDLRRDSMRDKLVLRHKIITAAREYFNQNDFLEIETPIMVKSTPEGARDYVVPSRVNPGKFYALPQSPQLYKQILMIAGVDRYYQVPRCLRDEDLRADRQPEHTQIDLEMSFVTSDEIRDVVEGMCKHILKEVRGQEIDEFRTFSYEEAMERFGTDKPDLRYELELTDMTEIAKKTDFGIFKEAEKVSCIVAEKDYSRREIDELTEIAKKEGAKGLAYAKVTKEGLDSGISKFVKDHEKELITKAGAKEGSTIFFIADEWKIALETLGAIRKKIASDMDLIPEDVFKFCWVKDFPLFAWNEEDKRWEPEHHMFSMPKPEFVDNFEEDPGSVKGDLWDLVLNGTELASGSIRVSNPDIQERIMRLIGHSKEDAQKKFGFLLEAYKYGGPIHGGMGIGADRLIALIAGTNDIREVIAFPKNKAAQCPMDGSPSEIDDYQLDELGISIENKKR